ncbi:Homeodomain-like domain-containing protein [Brevibacterium sp. 239c]|uniref:DUF2637 domain-containing protein n=1 Tax=Brevibacterium sp. 239c TaxID=1965356 RepID=UPI000C3D7170|nr:DUF2637 domain-containing protein [Brevibacterium sp. 239c]SMX69684.1 Homeodomain-like domain-containing protein [Brevibacterium sp. 239c]
MTIHASTGQRNRRWAVVTAVAGTVFIAAGAFWLSFTALADLAARSGVGGSQAWAWPLIVDGIIVVATVAAVALAGQRSAWYPWALLIGGSAVSVIANALHAVVAADADVPGVLAAAVAAVPPVVLLAITHLTVILTRPQPAPDTLMSSDDAVSPDISAPIEEWASAPGPGTVSSAEVEEIAALPAPAEESEQAIAPGTAQASADRDSEPTTDSGVARTDRRARAAQLRGQGWSNKKIARDLGVHPSTVGRWFTGAHLTDSTDDEEATP